MTVRQMLAIGLCVLLNAIDGFDVLSISFASPGIAKEWGIDRAALGVVLSMELIGMAAGSILLGQVADSAGRRPTAIGCLAIMALGMFGTTQVASIGALAATRLFTGLGIGGMLAATNALVAEFANDKWRHAAVAIMAAGYPMGVIAGGSITSGLLETGDWRDVFLFGAGMTALFLPLVSLLLPEPVSAVLQNRRGDTLARLNRSLRALGHATVSGLPPEDAERHKARLSDLFARGMAPVTVLLTAAYFLHIMTFYFILKWVPKIVVDMGFSSASAGGVLVWANVGGLIGGLLFSALSLRFSLKGLLVAFMLASTVTVAVFGLGQADLQGLSWAAAVGGFCTNAAVVGIYALVASSYPTEIRGGGTGFVIGVGRGGAALGPIAGGLLFQAGLGLAPVAAIMAAGSLIAALALLALPKCAGTSG
ncbi:MFS transporter [Novosphingobium sp. JCM 18896]|uniref:MFS transporter n=1 Tax=Novosphingobium sp. JCM 18896 TaxID=2989731 RepID=UPI002222B1E3|nr:MFS transporter [Novosphingobium sp. JCM 18896]MCW1427782.1 MFS transporter [Novosphingobium sp. JCM 18896]